MCVSVPHASSRNPRPRTAAVAALIVALAAAGAARAAAPLAGPGCDPSRPAVPHRAGGVAAPSEPPAGAPMPCATLTGPTTESATVGVAADRRTSGWTDADR